MGRCKDVLCPLGCLQRQLARNVKLFFEGKFLEYFSEAILSPFFAVKNKIIIKNWRPTDFAQEVEKVMCLNTLEAKQTTEECFYILMKEYLTFPTMKKKYEEYFALSLDSF